MKWGVDMFYYLLFGSIVLLSFVIGFLGKKFIQHLDTVTTFGFYDFKLDEFDKFEVIFTTLSIKNNELKEKVLEKLNNFTEDEKISEILGKIKMDYEDYVAEYTQFFNFFLLGY